MSDYTFDAARRASGLSTEQVADACGLSAQTIRFREKRPQDYRLKELSAMFQVLSPLGKEIFLKAAENYFNELSDVQLGNS